MLAAAVLAPRVHRRTWLALAGLAIAVAVFGDEENDQLVVDGRHYVRERLDPFEIAATTTQAAFKSTLSVYGLGKRRAIEVYDRRGGRVVRFVAVNAHVRSAGERLVITVGGEDDRRAYVVSGR